MNNQESNGKKANATARAIQGSFASLRMTTLKRTTATNNCNSNDNSRSPSGMTNKRGNDKQERQWQPREAMANKRGDDKQERQWQPREAGARQRV
jgi:hypothetical protein